MLFAGKQKKIEDQLTQYGREVSQCVQAMCDTIIEFCRTGDRVRLQEMVDHVHHAESRADDIRREIEVVMYSKALFPESRGDILGLLETMDKVPNQAEHTVQMLQTHHITIPQPLQAGIFELAAICRRCTEALLDAVAKLFTDFTNATVTIGKVDQLESEADQVELKLIETIFASDLPDLQKILLRDLVKHIASISDRAENVGDRLRIIVAKRKT